MSSPILLDLFSDVQTSFPLYNKAFIVESLLTLSESQTDKSDAPDIGTQQLALLGFHCDRSFANTDRFNAIETEV